MVSIGCSSGFWGDSAYAAAQLVRSGKVDFLVSDYLAEITMSLLARLRAKDPAQGYVPDFISTMLPLLPEVKERGIRIVTNAGGLAPKRCRDAFLAAALDSDLRIAVVEGDDLLPRIEELRSKGIREMFSNAPLPAKVASCNAYLGALPICEALNQGADIVITGRCVDSAVTLGVLMHAFGWKADQYNLLAAGSLAGHLIECGPQSTGGVFTDWERVPGWENMGYPIVECEADGSFVLTKPDATGGLVTAATAAEQLVYEIGDGANYLLPDVVCDFTEVALAQAGEDRVRVTGAKGRAPSTDYKVSATYAEGWRLMASMMVAGHEAGAKARRMASAIVARVRGLSLRQGYADFSEVSIEVIGAGDTYGGSPEADRRASEVVLKIGLKHLLKEPLELFSREMAQAGVAMAQGVTGLFAGRPSPSPVVRLFSFLFSKQEVPVRVDDVAIALPLGTPVGPRSAASLKSAQHFFPGPTQSAPLIAIAHGRSGDKGNDANIGIIARRPEFFPILRAQVSNERVRDFFAHYSPASVERYDLPGIYAINFVLRGVLGGGGMASLRFDPQGKAYAQMLLEMEIDVPSSILENRT